MSLSMLFNVHRFSYDGGCGSIVVVEELSSTKIDNEGNERKNTSLSFIGRIRPCSGRIGSFLGSNGVHRCSNQRLDRDSKHTSIAVF